MEIKGEIRKDASLSPPYRLNSIGKSPPEGLRVSPTVSIKYCRYAAAIPGYPTSSPVRKK
jgi:hypothetical protein